jgi:phosphoglycolate phosphatase
MTSSSIDDPDTIRRILAYAEALFLDFDGPVCNLFAGLRASVVVDQLCVVLTDGGYGDPPSEIVKSSDPFEVLKFAATLGEAEAEYVNAAFTALEVEAITTAMPTPGAHDLIRFWSRMRRPLAIVSNNSTLAVRAYLNFYELCPHVKCVVGRERWNPGILKPSPYLLKRAIAGMEVNGAATVFIGDSTTDVLAARAAGVDVVGYANKPGKIKLLTEMQPDAIVTSISFVKSMIKNSDR